MKLQNQDVALLHELAKQGPRGVPVWVWEKWDIDRIERLMRAHLVIFGSAQTKHFPLIIREEGEKLLESKEYLALRRRLR